MEHNVAAPEDIIPTDDKTPTEETVDMEQNVAAPEDIIPTDDKTPTAETGDAVGGEEKSVQVNTGDALEEKRLVSMRKTIPLHVSVQVRLSLVQPILVSNHPSSQSVSFTEEKPKQQKLNARRKIVRVVNVTQRWLVEGKELHQNLYHRAAAALPVIAVL